MEPPTRIKPLTLPSVLSVAVANLRQPTGSKSSLGIVKVVTMDKLGPFAMKLVGQIFAYREQLKRSGDSEIRH